MKPPNVGGFSFNAIASDNEIPESAGDLVQSSLTHGSSIGEESSIIRVPAVHIERRIPKEPREESQLLQVIEVLK